MRIPTKKLKIGFGMPIFGLGTWLMGGRRERDLNNDDAADIKAIQAAIELGVVHIDTAEVYAGGYSETLVGQAIKGYDRSKLFIVSKVKDLNMSYDSVINSCKQSLERLQTPYLDLYLLHQHNPNFSLKDTIRALDYLVEQGMVRNIGVSNFNKEFFQEAQSYTKNKIVCNQVHYNLEFREPEASGLLEYCQDNDIFLVAYRPVSKGVLLQDIPEIFKEMCEKYQKTPAQVALNWLMSQPYVVTLSKTRSIEHLKDNLGAVGWEMDKEDIEKLRTEYPDQKSISDVVPLG
ncbi:MAG: aldo/keto reductase [Candidatus Pacebacteria bacterium]|nr:aldo/keto reductase [Candidatus Paceibacterota bacterium]